MLSHSQCVAAYTVVVGLISDGEPTGVIPNNLSSNVDSRYLLTIGLVPVFSLRWSLPPTLGCIPKQPDSEKTRHRRAGGRYRPHTVHGMSLDQKDSGPRATTGKQPSVCHISPIRPSDGDSALGSSLFARHY
ncbi:hypothetical protein VZT92_016077 [Zoarces viviparus]|uniref:Uncharacterized protein n=1 Tax=Zoarces viviparus TaxID=48416 RepID=A0AAW1ESY3_ZOAVI